MRTLTPQRRAAAVCAVCAAVIPSSTLLMHSNPTSNPVQFAGGMLIGLAVTLSFGALIIARRRNCN